MPVDNCPTSSYNAIDYKLRITAIKEPLWVKWTIYLRATFPVGGGWERQLDFFEVQLSKSGFVLIPIFPARYKLDATSLCNRAIDPTHITNYYINGSSCVTKCMNDTDCVTFTDCMTFLMWQILGHLAILMTISDIANDITWPINCHCLMILCDTNISWQLDCVKVCDCVTILDFVTTVINVTISDRYRSIFVPPYLQFYYKLYL